MSRHLPERAGNLHYYINAGDGLPKYPDDNPKSGLLICSDNKADMR